MRRRVPFHFHNSGEIGSQKCSGVSTRNRTFPYGPPQDVRPVLIKEFELPSIRCMTSQAECLLKRPAWDMKTLKSANHANLEHDPVTVVRDCRPKQRAVHDMPPVWLPT